MQFLSHLAACCERTHLFTGPRWASWNIGIFICIRCAGIHRNLGVHISRVKSVNLDQWTQEQIQVRQGRQVGRRVGGAVSWEEAMGSSERPRRWEGDRVIRPGSVGRGNVLTAASANTRERRQALPAPVHLPKAAAVVSCCPPPFLEVSRGQFLNFGCELGC